MFKSDYAILSLPVHEKHYVLRTNLTSEGTLTLDIDDLRVCATITAICDSYDESIIVVNNLRGE